MDFRAILSRTAYCDKVLNIGCGAYGLKHDFLHPINAASVKVGIDLNEKRIETWEDSDWAILKYDLTKPLPFVDKYFDVVIGFDILEHLLYNDAWRLIEESERVCNGILVFFCPEGFIDTVKHQREFVKTPWDVHQSAMYPEWFEHMGYEVEVLHNLHKFGDEMFNAFFAYKLC